MRTHLARIEGTGQAARGAVAELVQAEMEHIDLRVMCTIGPGIIGRALGPWQVRTGTVELIIHDVWGTRAEPVAVRGAGLRPDRAVGAPPRTLRDLRVDARKLGAVVPRGNALDDEHPLGLADHAHHPYLDRLRCEFRTTVFDHVAAHGIEMDITVRSEREAWIQMLIAEGQGLSLMPSSSVVIDGLVACPLAEMPVKRRIDIVQVHGRPVRPEVQDFVDYLRGLDWAGL